MEDRQLKPHLISGNREEEDFGVNEDVFSVIDSLVCGRQKENQI